MTTIEILTIDYALSPEIMFGKIADLPDSVWLDSGYPSFNHSRYDLITGLPENSISMEGNSQAELNSFIAQTKELLHRSNALLPSSATPFQGGLVGYLGYEMSRSKQGLPATQERIIPDAMLGLYFWAIIYDHVRRSAQLIFHPLCDIDTRKTVIERTIDSSIAPEQEQSEFTLLDRFHGSETKENYLNNINRIKAYIEGGDIYQANYAQHFSSPYSGDPLTAYLEQRKQHPAPFSAYLSLGEKAVLSHSPEQFIHIQGREIQTSPIKGTAPRSNDPVIDKQNSDELRASTKDRAENLMIVDLLRNDLGKSCEAGSIQVPKLFELHSFSNVHHLVSEVRGHLPEQSSLIDVLLDCHPGGSITGAPKKRAIEVIEELETKSRSIFCGSIGYISFCGTLSTNIAIRSFVADGKKMHCWAGGGIVFDSDPEKEFQETLHKIGPMMSSMENIFLR